MRIVLASIVGLAILLSWETAEAQRFVAARIVRVPADDGIVFLDVDEQIGALIGLTRVEAGLYSVTFDPPFTCDPIVTVTASGPKGRIATVSPRPQEDRVRIVFRDVDGSRADPLGFHLVAVGCE